MKSAAIHRNDIKMRPNLPYPNAATQKELFNKFLDFLLVGAIGAGVAACLLFLMVMA